ncbi:hypothetical protein QTG54_013194, partial [Skeletonema marinoi]
VLQLFIVKERVVHGVTRVIGSPVSTWYIVIILCLSRTYVPYCTYKYCEYDTLIFFITTARSTQKVKKLCYDQLPYSVKPKGSSTATPSSTDPALSPVVPRAVLAPCPPFVDWSFVPPRDWLWD